MRELLRYYGNCLRIAWRHSFGKSDAIAGAIGVLFPAIASVLGKPEIALSALAWQIPLAFFATIFGVRLFLAPFWIRQEREAALSASDNERQRELEATEKDRNDAIARARESESLFNERLAKREGELDEEHRKEHDELANKIDRLQAENVRLSTECAQLRDSHDFRRALSLSGPHAEVHPDGGMALFRLQVLNGDSHRTVDDVCVRVTGLKCVDGSDKRDLLPPAAKPLLAISGTGQRPSSPPAVTSNLVASDSLFFDFVTVHSDRRANHSMCYGEYVKDYPFHFQGNEHWRQAHDAVLGAGKYKVTIEVQGRNVLSIRREFVFWGDKSGPHCTDAEDPAAQNRQPLEFAPTEIEILPANMHPHQLDALKTELRKPDYDGMTPESVFWKINDDKLLCGLAGLRFVTSATFETVPENRRQRAIIVSDEYMSQFPGGIPGFPNAIHRSDFDLAWQAVRGTI